MRILIADDHAVVRRGLKEILAAEFEGVEFGEAESAAEALQLIRKQEWDVVMLDITMPGRSGLDVLKEVKAAHPKRPVLVLSMHAENQYGVRSLKAGADGYLTKETAPEELVNAVKKVLAGRKYVSPTLAEMLAYRLDPVSEKPLYDELSDREYQVMCLIASGKSVSEIAK